MHSFLSIFVLAATAAASFIPQDTPDVAHAKAQHLANVEQTKLQNVLGATHFNVHHLSPSHGLYASGWNHGWTGPIAVPVVVNGQVQDTPDVAEAKAKHLQVLAAETARKSAPLGHYEGGWNVAGGVHANAHAEPWHPSEGYLRYGPAHIVVIDGQVQDTPEVAHAKQEHIAVLHAAKARSSHNAW